MSNTKNTSKITFCALISALSVVVMLTSHFPYLTYAIPALAGLCMMIPVIETDCKWALGSFLTSILPVFLFSETEAKLLYIAFFGYYPILKAVIDKKTNKVFSWIFKFAVFNIAVVLVYLILAPLMGVSVEEFGNFGKIGVILFWIAANVVFVLYDNAIAGVSVFYTQRIHPKIKGLIK